MMKEKRLDALPLLRALLGDRLTARPQSAPPTVQRPWIVPADGGLRFGQRPITIACTVALLQTAEVLRSCKLQVSKVSGVRFPGRSSAFRISRSSLTSVLSVRSSAQRGLLALSELGGAVPGAPAAFSVLRPRLPKRGPMGLQIPRFSFQFSVFSFEFRVSSFEFRGVL